MNTVYSSNYKPGNCWLRGEYTQYLERHHISYKPEITRDLCHNCHFLCHFFPNRLTDSEKLKLLETIFTHEHALTLLGLYRNNPIMLAKLFAPSRREAIHKAQREELERIRTGNTG